MPKYSSKELNGVYHALANTARRKILTRLAQAECTVSELAEPFDMSLAAVSKHIKVLEKAGLVKKRKHATTHICSISYDPLKSAAALVHHFEQFWVHDGGLVSEASADDESEEFSSADESEETSNVA